MRFIVHTYTSAMTKLCPLRKYLHRIDAGESAPETSEALSTALPSSSAAEGMAEAMMLAHQACESETLHIESLTGSQAIELLVHV